MDLPVALPTTNVELARETVIAMRTVLEVYHVDIITVIQQRALTQMQTAALILLVILTTQTWDQALNLGCKAYLTKKEKYPKSDYFG